MGRDILLAFFSMAGLLTAALWLYGWLLRTEFGPESWMLVPGHGSGEGLEQYVRRCVWLRSLGLLDSTIVVADVDLTPAGRELALHLTARWPDVILWPLEELPDYIRQMT